MGYVLALDQGATKTAALVAARSGQMMGVGYGAGAVHASDGMEAAMAAVLSASEQALRQAGLSWRDVDRISAGMSGADWPDEYALLETSLRQATGVADVRVVNDCMIAYRAGTDSRCGAVLCAGTGLNVAVVSPTGESYIYGYYINGDDQGGTALGRLSLRAVWAAESGIGEATALTRIALDHFAQPSVDALLRQYVEGRLGPTSAMVPILEQAVACGDAVAAQIVTGFGQRLARYVTAGLRRFDMAGLPVEVVLSGGIFKARLPGLGETVSQAILAAAPSASLIEARYEPVVGALLLALEVPLGSQAVADGARKFNLMRVSS